MKKMTGAACLLAALLAAGTVGATAKISAHANSAPPYWRGTTAAGVIVTGEQCPIEVEHELLTLNIPALPQTSYSSQEEFERYSASVTAEYTFYNPTDMDVEMSLAFPFGTRPEYTFAGYDAATGQSSYFDDTARYAITADGEAVEREVRHTYQPYAFNVESMYLISDEKRENDFFKPDLPVTKYNFTLTFPKNKNSGVAEFELKYNPSRTKILCSHFRAEETVNGNLHLYLYADRGDNSHLTFTSVGEAPEILAMRVREDSVSWASENWKEMKGASVDELPAERTTFEQYVESARPEEIGEVDFYNGVLDLFAPYASSSYWSQGFFNAEPSRLSAHDFMRWYTYSLRIPAGECLTNTVTAPLYPTINHRGCEYEYLLSPAKKWADFSELDIVVNTDLEIYSSSLELNKTESGYSLHSDGLPASELRFAIVGDYEYPRKSGVGLSGGVIVVLALVGLAAVSTVVEGIAVGIVFGVIRAKKKKQNK